jgi:hypothetical protein
MKTMARSKLKITAHNFRMRAPHEVAASLATTITEIHAEDPESLGHHFHAENWFEVWLLELLWCLEGKCQHL